jgi:hypothetical protein
MNLHETEAETAYAWLVARCETYLARTAAHPSTERIASAQAAEAKALAEALMAEQNAEAALAGDR